MFLSKWSISIYLIISGFFSAVLRIWKVSSSKQSIHFVGFVGSLGIFFFPKYATKSIVLDPVSRIPHVLASLFNFHTSLFLVCMNFIEISIDT